MLAASTENARPLTVTDKRQDWTSYDVARLGRLMSALRQHERQRRRPPLWHSQPRRGETAEHSTAYPNSFTHTCLPFPPQLLGRFAHSQRALRPPARQWITEGKRASCSDNCTCMPRNIGAAAGRSPTGCGCCYSLYTYIQAARESAAISNARQAMNCALTHTRTYAVQSTHIYVTVKSTACNIHRVGTIRTICPTRGQSIRGLVNSRTWLEPATPNFITFTTTIM